MNAEEFHCQHGRGESIGCDECGLTSSAVRRAARDAQLQLGRIRSTVPSKLGVELERLRSAMQQVERAAAWSMDPASVEREHNALREWIDWWKGCAESAPCDHYWDVIQTRRGSERYCVRCNQRHP